MSQGSSPYHTQGLTLVHPPSSHSLIDPVHPHLRKKGAERLEERGRTAQMKSQISWSLSGAIEETKKPCCKLIWFASVITWSLYLGPVMEILSCCGRHLVAWALDRWRLWKFRPWN